MSDSTRIKKLREEVEKLCGNCDRPDKEEIGNIILSAMAFGFGEGLKAPSADRPQGEWIDAGSWMGFECSRCKCHSRYVTPFCPHCGARMKGADDADG